MTNDQERLDRVLADAVRIISMVTLARSTDCEIQIAFADSDLMMVTITKKDEIVNPAEFWQSEFRVHNQRVIIKYPNRLYFRLGQKLKPIAAGKSCAVCNALAVVSDVVLTGTPTLHYCVTHIAIPSGQIEEARRQFTVIGKTQWDIKWETQTPEQING